jgi:hypothetical protein
MNADFFSRLGKYYIDVAAVLRGEAKVASIFPNTTDIGMSREKIYAEVLRLHVPSKCNVFLGGYLFGSDGTESRQLDVIATTDTTPNYNFLNRDGGGKSFSPVDGTIAVASIKSVLNKNELIDALEGIASIPRNKTIEGRVNPMLKVHSYDDWPYKIIYAPTGISQESLSNHLKDFYNSNPDIPQGRRPNLIHVGGSYLFSRVVLGMDIWDEDQQKNLDLEIGSWYSNVHHPDLTALLWTINEIQIRVQTSSHILFSYNDLLRNVLVRNLRR